MEKGSQSLTNYIMTSKTTYSNGGNIAFNVKNQVREYQAPPRIDYS